jgi:HK97 family phage portal protein
MSMRGPSLLDRARRSLRHVGAAFRALAPGQMLPPWDDYWYQNHGYDSAAGMSVSPETAMRLSAVYACIRVRSETLASSPLIIWKQLADGGRVRAPEHPLFSVLHGGPNIWQTSLEWIEMMQAHLDLRGNAFSHILPGPRGAVDQLIPLHPDLVQVFRLPNGKLKYQVRSRFTAEIDWYTMDEMLHLRGLSSDGLVGLSPVAVQRDTIGNALGMQDYQGRQLANDTATRVWMSHPAKFKDDEAREKFRESYQKAQTQANRGKVPVLESGMQLHQLGLSNEDAQFLQSMLASREEICSIFRMPPHKIAILARSTNNNIEHQGIEFVQDCMEPIARRWERRINLDLVDPINEALGAEPGEYFAEFDMSKLERGALKDRYDAYAVGRNGGWLNPDRICQFEGMNPIGKENGGDKYWRPANMVEVGTIVLQAGSTEQPDPELPPGKKNPDQEQQEPGDAPSPSGGDEEAAVERRALRTFAAEAAGRVVRREVRALESKLKRAASIQQFQEQAAAFYETHTGLVAETMMIPGKEALAYVAENLHLLRAAAEPLEAQCALDWIDDTAPDRLVRSAMKYTRPIPAGAAR